MTKNVSLLYTAVQCVSAILKFNNKYYENNQFCHQIKISTIYHLYIKKSLTKQITFETEKYCIQHVIKSEMKNA